ncbi:hypothetical protein [Spongiivirga citrea]|uniref:Uncharacterized protein n=1 Tax=Spongiivirga citrea TaxID=1481457 RepID=A0A6M0CGG3_9FLAO|nr:hypothetical protein [Spongiivirga citrea]NER16542.1 hypothetical protein [Spongiivirga citrea]
MIATTLRRDVGIINTEGVISSTRPCNYWLIVFKQILSTKRKKNFQLKYLVFLLPIFGLIFLLLTSNYEAILPMFIVSIFAIAIAFALLGYFDRYGFLNLESIDNLAKFIIDIKGDVKQNLASITLNLGDLQKSEHEVDPKRLGIKPKAKTKFKAHQLNRIRAKFFLKDNSFVQVSLHQMVVRVTTSKRRSSGKYKTKVKYKHRFYYLLTLRLNANTSQVLSADRLGMLSDKYIITCDTIDGYHYIKIKYKEKLHSLPKKISNQQKTATSYYSDMLTYLYVNNVYTRTNNLNKIGN